MPRQSGGWGGSNPVNAAWSGGQGAPRDTVPPHWIAASAAPRHAVVERGLRVAEAAAAGESEGPGVRPARLWPSSRAPASRWSGFCPHSAPGPGPRGLREPWAGSGARRSSRDSEGQGRCLGSATPGSLPQAQVPTVAIRGYLTADGTDGTGDPFLATTHIFCTVLDSLSV